MSKTHTYQNMCCITPLHLSLTIHSSNRLLSKQSQQHSINTYLFSFYWKRSIEIIKFINYPYLFFFARICKAICSGWLCNTPIYSIFSTKIRNYGFYFGFYFSLEKVTAFDYRFMSPSFVCFCMFASISIFF